MVDLKEVLMLEARNPLVPRMSDWDSHGIPVIVINPVLLMRPGTDQTLGLRNYPFNSARETLGLVVCHAVCGAVGALPPTGVFVRTSLNLGCSYPPAD